MVETLFRFDEHNMHACQMSYRGVRGQEYYLGEYSIESDGGLEVRAEKRAIGIASIIHNTANTRQSFKRTRTHIRKDSTDVTVFWFVNRGSVLLSHPLGEVTVSEGEMLVTKSLTPSMMDCLPDAQSVYDVYHIVVPTHALEGILADDSICGVKLEREVEALQLAKQLLTYLAVGNNAEADNGTQKILDSVFALIGQALQACDIPVALRPSLSEVRVNEVVRFINSRLSDPNLNIDMVAEGCGISPRYTFLLLKSQGTSFSAFVWERRLKMASQLICSFEKAEMLVSEVAYRVGFKSAAHFSRMFKRTFNLTPTEYRQRYLASSRQPSVN